MSTKVKQKNQIRYKTYDQDQIVHLPVLLSQVVKDNVLAQIINEVVEGIEMEKLDQYYSHLGKPGYHPKMLIKVWIYGFCNKVYTTRPLARKLKEDLVFIWLGGNQQPCFKTLSDFRSRRMKELVEVVFKEVLTYLVVNEYVDLNDLYIDGSKWEANANKYKIQWRKNTERYKAAVEERIDQLLDQIATLQMEEDLHYGSKDLNAYQDVGQIQVALKSKQLSQHIAQVNELVEAQSDKKVARQLQRLSKKLDKENEKLKKYEAQQQVLGQRNSYSRTDEDAIGMRMKDDQLKAGYNVQISTSHQYIITTTIHQNGSDSPTLTPHVEKLEENVEGLVDTNWQVELTMDAGYGSEENYDLLERKNMTGFVKYPLWFQEHTGKLEKEKFRRENWLYNEQEDYFLCPNEKRLNYIETIEKLTQNGYSRNIKIYEAEGCTGCPLFEKCRSPRAKPGTNRRVQISTKLEAYKDKARELLASDRGKQKRSQRSVDVETPFGDIKHNMGHKRFVLRGIEKVNVEFTLLAIAHNLRKVYCEKTGRWREYYAQRADKKRKRA